MHYQEYFESFIQSGWYILGENVKSFEREFAHFCGSNYCVGVASGLDALVLAIDAFNFPSGSEVIVPSNTYIATIMAIVRSGMKPVLVEPDIETYNLDPLKIEENITSKTRAIIAVHLYGKPCNMGSIMTIANSYDLQVLEDCAQAHGAEYKGQKVGSFGVGCFSFYPTKNLGALGDAGAITTYDQKYSDKLMSLRCYGSNKKYHNDYIGYNSRLDEIQAGFLSIKLKYLSEITRYKRGLAQLYIDNLNDKFIKPVVDDDYLDVYHIFNIRCKERDELRGYLLSRGVKTEVHYPVAPHHQKSMQGILTGEFCISEEIHNTTLSLPISYGHTQEEIMYVIKVLNEW